MVIIIESRCMIVDEGNPVLFDGEDAFDIFFHEAHGTTISNMIFDGVNGLLVIT